jgi:hypothetical protein
VQKRVGEVIVAYLLATPKPCLSFKILSQEVRVCVITGMVDVSWLDDVYTSPI